MIKLIGGYYTVKELNEREQILRSLEETCQESKEKYDKNECPYYISNPQWTDVEHHCEGYDVYFTLLLTSNHDVTFDSPEILELSAELICSIVVY